MLQGPYNVNYTRFDFCSGPRSKNLTRNTISLRSEGFKFYGQFNLTFLVQTHIDEVKIVVYSSKDEKIGNVLWTYKLNDPCKHFAFATLIKNVLKAPNCIVNKGTYSQILNFEEIQTTFFGTSFFYGKYFLKVTAISKKGNLICILIGIVFTKKSGSKN
ncbi:uncharacterized protein LOC123869625 [Maniola jurtina]|uniref:uncharacterized protein LOC123869625 n=1 Tax=Maniola jurtina TaxID=191418 RepID=UPI001E686B55|nr:uncharacterized protein LOC123869625 [Maniola jurtina]